MRIRTAPKGEPVAEIPISPALNLEVYDGKINIPLTEINAPYFIYHGIKNII